MTVLKRYAPFVAIAAILAAAAAWRGALTPGIALYLVMVLTMMTIRTRYAAEQAKVASRAREGWERILVTLVGIGMSYIPAFGILTPFLGFADYPNPPWALALGTAFGALGLWLFWRSHADLGRNWSVALEIREAHSLVTSGVYARIRHPMYSAICLICLAQAALLGNVVMGLSGLIAFTLLYLDRVGPEEEMMEAEFGAEYDAYRARTGRLLPKIGG